LACRLLHAALQRRGSPLPPALRSLVQTGAPTNHCAFCVGLNASISAQRSGSLDKVLAADRWRDNDLLFDARERLALEYAEAITRTDGHVGQILTRAGASISTRRR
jgi:alkylhydroperoxidase family enzyme